MMRHPGAIKAVLWMRGVLPLKVMIDMSLIYRAYRA
jgi:hypothetical protein